MHYPNHTAAMKLKWSFFYSSAVHLLVKGTLSDLEMHSIAKELGLSETAFIGNWECWSIKKHNTWIRQVKKITRWNKWRINYSIVRKSRFWFWVKIFWPWIGTNEDPVTLGTHTFLAKYWGTRLNKTKMNSFQCLERTGFMELELLSEQKMTIKSKAQIVLKGELKI